VELLVEKEGQWYFVVLDEAMKRSREKGHVMGRI